MTKTKALLRSDRQDQIVLWFAIRMEKNIDTYCSLSEIARGLGLAPSTKLRKMTEELVPARLEKLRFIGKGVGKATVIGWRVARSAGLKKERLIVINHKGNSQLELWK